MNWDAISAVSELVGAFLIVASMIYVARQLRQTNTMMRVNSASELLERDYEIVVPLIESGEIAEIWLKGGEYFADLRPADQQRLLFFERRAIMLWHHLYQLRNQSLLPDANWHGHLWIMRNLGRRQALREAWAIFRDGFELPFQEFVDKQFSLGDSEVSESLETEDR